MRRKSWIIVSALLLLAACSKPYAHVPLEPPKLYTQAEKNLRAARYPEAAEAFRTFLSSTTDPTFRARAYYQLAEALYRSGEHRETLDALDQLEQEFPDESWPQVSALRGDAQYALGNRTEAFLAWEEAWHESAKADRTVLQTRMEEAADDLTDSEARELHALATLPIVLELIAPRVPAPAEVAAVEADLEQTEPAETALTPETLASGELFSAESLPGLPGSTAEFEPGTESFVTGQIVAPAPVAAPEEDLESTPELPAPKIAALLPLTGPDRTYGARALSGLRLAFADQPEALAVRDTGGDPEITTRLLAELATDSSVVAVVGPLRGSEAQAAAPQAQRLHLPLLMLAHRDGLTTEPYVFQTSLTRAQQVAALVRHAMHELGAKRFAVLHPDDGYGRTFMRIFRDEVRQRGGQLVGSESYVPGQPEFGYETALVEHWRRERRLDALFIPDAAERAVALGATLRRSVPQVALLGTESWNRPEAIARAGSGIDGAVFTDAFFAGSLRPSTRSFVERFRGYAGRSPTIFEAQGFDVGMLLRKALESGARTREEIVSQLRTTGSFEAAGRLQATGGGFQRELFLLRAHGGYIEEVSTPAG